MKSSATSNFWRAYHSLSPEIRVEANKAYRLWKENPRHPSLRFEGKGQYWSVRITRGWLALGRMHEGTGGSIRSLLPSQLYLLFR
jgi:hypothetical protein